MTSMSTVLHEGICSYAESSFASVYCQSLNLIQVLLGVKATLLALVLQRSCGLHMLEVQTSRCLNSLHGSMGLQQTCGL